jgi:hypothetical protein
MEKQSLFNRLVILRVFAAVFVTLFGLGIMIKTDAAGTLFFVGTFSAAIGLTFFLVLWLGSKTG